MEPISSSRPFPGLSDDALTWRFVISAGLIIVAVIALAAAGMSAIGAASRHVPNDIDGARVVTVDSGPEAVEALEAAGVRGARLIHATSAFGFREDNLSSLVETASAKQAEPYPPPVIDAAAGYRSILSTATYMFVAVRLGVAREVVVLMSPAAFARRAESQAGTTTPGIDVSESRVRVNAQGIVRMIYPRLPSMTGPAVLVVNASYFEEATPDALRAELQSSGTDLRLVVAVSDSDDPTISADARTRLNEFAAAMTQELNR